MNRTEMARRLRRDQTGEERRLWRALRAGRFAGFKFRRQHPIGGYILDFYCPLARLAVELDGFQHGLPDHIEADKARDEYLASQQIQVLRFWNHLIRKNQSGVLLEIWTALERRTGCVQILRKEQNQRFAPPNPRKLTSMPATPPVQWPSR